MRESIFGNRVTVVDHSLVRHKLTLLRSVTTPPPLFRGLLRETALLLAFAALADLPTRPVAVETPLGATEGETLLADPVLVSILRAGNGLLDGFLEIMPSASVGFLGMYRDHETLEAIEYYEKLPGDLGGRVTVVLDPMLATANTAVAAITKLRARGAVDLRFVCLVAAPEGIARVLDADPAVTITTAVVDEGLNEIGYIVPGLGDAGDRTYGT